MPYSSFTIKRVQKELSVEIIEKTDFFSGIAPREIGSHLKETLSDNVSLAAAVNTGKARSELIIAPVLVEIRKIFDKKISFFSGIELNVDKERDLTGFCDFIISQSPEQLFLNTPVITVVEAKNENIMSGLGQCAAEMIASRIFNEQEGTTLSKIGSPAQVVISNPFIIIFFLQNRFFLKSRLPQPPIYDIKGEYHNPTCYLCGQAADAECDDK